MIISCKVDDGRELIIFLEVERFFIDLLFFHEIGIILINPFHPAVAVDQNNVLLREDKVGDHLAIEIAFEVIADHLFLSVGGVHEHILAITCVNIVDFVPAEGLECAIRCRLYFLLLLYFDVLLQLPHCRLI